MQRATSKQTNKQTNKQTSKPTSRRTNRTQQCAFLCSAEASTWGAFEDSWENRKACCTFVLAHLCGPWLSSRQGHSEQGRTGEKGTTRTNPLSAPPLKKSSKPREWWEGRGLIPAPTLHEPGAVCKNINAIRQIQQTRCKLARSTSR